MERWLQEAEGLGLFGPEPADPPHLERSAVLCRIRGVSPWTADMVGIFHFLDPDISPSGDAAAVAVLRRLTGITDTVEVVARFAPCRSILAGWMGRIRNRAPVITSPV